MRKIVLVISCLVASFTYAQNFNKYTFNIGGGVGIPVGTTSDFASVDANLVLGGGVNLRPAFGFTGEFMWYGLPPSTPELNAVSAVRGRANLYSLTGNFIGRIGTHRRVGAYVIGGGGWYHRTWDITAPALVPGTVCGPSFSWYGVACVNGLVSTDAVLRSGSADGGGLNIGAGVTIGHGTGAKFYAEFRYHHIYYSTLNTDVIPVTFGVRW